MIRKISAQYIYTVCSEPLKKGIIVLDHNNTILEVIDTGGELKETERLEFYDGIITPGFVNAHTHLELSHLKHKISHGTGITGFIQNLEQTRNQGNIEYSMLNAENELRHSGCVAYGDIVNTPNTIPLKKKGKLLQYSFIEIFATNPTKADFAYNKGNELYQQFIEAGLSCSLVPHAPYSVSLVLWEKIIHHQAVSPIIWSVHNQESNDENLLFLNKTGKFPELLQQFSPAFSSWKAPGKSSVQFMIPYFNVADKVLLVHNTFISSSDLEKLLPLKEKLYFVLCPKSNLYIENMLPPASLINQYGFNITIGTDSLASNDKLSVLDEMMELQNGCNISFDNIIRWATINGASALGFDNQIGTIEPGKKPGLNLISNFNYQEKKLTPKSMIQVIA